MMMMMMIVIAYKNMATEKCPYAGNTSSLGVIIQLRQYIISDLEPDKHGGTRTPHVYLFTILQHVSDALFQLMMFEWNNGNLL